MQRREFCKLVAAATAAGALPAMGQESSSSPSGFNQYKEDYAAFCAKSPGERVFYTVENGKIVETKLDEAAWRPSEWGKPPELPVPGGSWDGVPMNSPIPSLAGEGPYKPTWDSLLQYDAPQWYQDAKFGIWAHWSPQCVPETGDWYARTMYEEGQGDYKYQLEHYGPQSRFGYKDICAQWTLLNWEPDELISRFKKAGARFFISLANHHDGFDAWDSKHQPWNAAAIGPHRDVVGLWAASARKKGLRFGVTVHEARNWWWFQTAHGADKSGPYAGVPYDGKMTASDGKKQWWQGLDPHCLYGVKHPIDALPDISYVKNFYDRTRDLIDQHDPDLLLFDNGRMPLGWGGMNLAAYFYNHNLQTHGGKLEAVLNGGDIPAQLAKALVADVERGVTSKIMPYPWQSETCIGDWHYQRQLYDKPGEYGGYLLPRDIIHWLIDTVSKNGTFILKCSRKAGRHHRQQGNRRPRRHHRLDAGERRSHLRDPHMEDLWRGTTCGEKRIIPGEQHLGARCAGHPLHAEQSQHRDLCDRAGMAIGADRGEGVGNRGGDEPRQDRQHRIDRHPGAGEMDAIRRRTPRGVAQAVSPGRGLRGSAEGIARLNLGWRRG